LALPEAAWSIPGFAKAVTMKSIFKSSLTFGSLAENLPLFQVAGKPASTSFEKPKDACASIAQIPRQDYRPKRSKMEEKRR
jgi:hypothetical protein